MKFRYTALSSANKQLSGHLEAADLESAKGQLHKMGLSILDFQEISDDEYARETAQEKALKNQQGVLTFTFQATDNKGKPVEGTIDALNKYSAYSRLVSEYKFTLTSLTTTDLSAAPTSGAQGEQSLQEMAERYQRENPETTENRETGSEMDELTRGEETVDQAIAASIDEVIRQTKKATQENQAFFSAEYLVRIEKKQNELDRIRQSNNINHITEVVEELFELIKHPDRIDTAAQEDRKQFDSALDEIGGSTLFKKQSTLYSKVLGLSKIQKWSDSISGGFFKNIKQKLPWKKSEKKQPDFSKEWNSAFIISEIDSFLSWLLTFYLAYFCLAAYSLEKNIGLPRDFVFQTLRSPLITNITIFLLMSHFLFFLKRRFLEGRIWSSLFLFGVGYGVYGLTVINF